MMFDGDEFQHNGRTFTYRTEADTDISVMDDGDWFGRLEWTHDRNERGYTKRPFGFDGNAEVIETDHYSKLWWQPPTDVKRGTIEFDQLRGTLRDLLNYGYCGVIVTDSDGREESLWGIGATDSEGCENAARELASQLCHEFERESANAQWAIDHEIVTV